MTGFKRNEKTSVHDVHCTECNGRFAVVFHPGDPLPEFCLHCGVALHLSKAATIPSQEITEVTPSTGFVSFVQNLVPKADEIAFSIGPYHVLKSIGKGGMGEVFLAYDTICGRRMALKRIRSDMNELPQMHQRFLKEARITSQLTHPAIIPIYAIQDKNKETYYTMPFVEGETLKQILRTTRINQKKGEPLHHIGASIPALIRIFIQVCQAVAYAHAKGVLHRDLKPENIIVGPYGEVLILDWGLAKLMSAPEEENDDLIEQKEPSSNEITRIGKVVGTISYMSPERAKGKPADLQTEIYALGVILYQILTLHPPFQRGSLKEFRKNMKSEVLPEPIEVAPYRDIPRILVGIVKRCLSSNLETRYGTVDELLKNLENYVEGRSEWFQVAEFDIHKKDDWEFQENVLIAEHIAITRGQEISDWVSLMISQATFSENTKVDARVRIGEEGEGVGFLLSIPEPSERAHINDGYCLWLGSDLNPTTNLMRSTVEVVQAPEIFLERNKWYNVRIEKIDNNIYFYLNNELQFSYISHLPIVGTHIGFLSRDDDFEVENFRVSIGSQNVIVNCLTVPDAFLAHKDYTTALAEYRRIGYSFPGRAEGREAMFRAGVTLLEQARNCDSPKESEKLYEQALEEFEKLHDTPGAPLEYLGKALVYQAIRDYEEELKCFDLAFRRYPNHPLLNTLEEQIIHRLHVTSRHNRKAAFEFILLILRHMPKIANSQAAKKILDNVQKYQERLFFIEETGRQVTSKREDKQLLNIELAFWLAKPYLLGEIIEELLMVEKPSTTLLGDALFALTLLGSWRLAKETITQIESSEKASTPLKTICSLLKIPISCYEEKLDTVAQIFISQKTGKLTPREEHVLIFLADFANTKQQPKIVHTLAEHILPSDLSQEGLLLFNCQKIWAYLLEKNWEKAGEILHSFPLEMLNQEKTPLHFLYGCWLYVTEGKEISHIHFSGVLDVLHPRTWNLFSHYLTNKIGETMLWFQRAFMWEKRQLYKQLVLFYLCTGDEKKAEHYHSLEIQEYIDVD